VNLIPRPPARGPGRRPGGPDTRGEILAAARAEFSRVGYDAATLRSIAAAAGVDPALIHHYFGTKEQLFVAAMELPFEPATTLPEVLNGDPSRLGERFVRLFLSVWDDPVRRAPFVAMIRSAMSHERAATMLRGFVRTALLGRAAEHLDADPLRIELAAGQLVGVVMMRYVLRLEPLASAGEDEVVALLAPTIQRYLVG
jgi:AcrR family transcriptional regulator